MHTKLIMIALLVTVFTSGQDIKLRSTSKGNLVHGAVPYKGKIIATEKGFIRINSNGKGGVYPNDYSKKCSDTLKNKLYTNGIKTH